jgi:hypothetical protein
MQAGKNTDSRVFSYKANNSERYGVIIFYYMKLALFLTCKSDINL